MLFRSSTDCVFDGTKGNYLENNEPNSDDIYGKTKFLGEINYQNTCTIRTSIIGHEYYNKLGCKDQCLYEQGRHFSYYYKGPLKVGKKVPHAVERFFVNSFIEKVCV